MRPDRLDSMTIPNRELVELRQIAQLLADNPAADAQAAAEHLVLAQGQHLSGAIASIAYRSVADTFDDVVDSFNDRRLARGYPMRGTLFVASAKDLAWTTEICGPRQLRCSAKRRQGHGIDDQMLNCALDVAEREFAAQEGKYGLPAASPLEIGEAWEAAHIPTNDGRRYHLIYTLIASGKLVYGPITTSESGSSLVQLLVPASQWLPANSYLGTRFNGDKDAAITEWLRRYLNGHGPATIRDFAWWTKLPLGVIRSVEDAATQQLETYGTDVDGEVLYGRAGLWETLQGRRREVGKGRLLAPFDELVLGYPNRLRLLSEANHSKLAPGNNGVFKNGLLRAGQLVGTWTGRVSASGRATAAMVPFAGDFSATAVREFNRALANYPR